MTRYYTHIGETAAVTAVAALPDISGLPTTMPALPAPAIVTIPATTLRDLADRLTPENIEETREQLRHLVAPAHAE